MSRVNQCPGPRTRSRCAPPTRGWCGTPLSSRSKTALVGLGVLEGYAGYLVRDDYAGWHQFDAQLAGVGQCAAHLIRHAKGVLECHPTQQQWAGQIITVMGHAFSGQLPGGFYAVCCRFRYSLWTSSGVL